MIQNKVRIFRICLRRPKLLLSSLMVLILGLCSCSLQSSRLIEVKIGINPWPGYDYLYLASRKGFLDDSRFRFRFVEFSSLTDSRRAFERQLIDIAGSTLVEVVFALHQSHTKPIVFYICDESNGADQILGQKWISDIAHLRGKKVGVELGSLGIYELDQALDRHKMSLKEVQLLPMDQMMMKERFLNKTVDAIVSYPPVSLEVLKAGGRSLFTSRELKGKLQDVFIADEYFINKYPEAIELLRVGFDKALEFSQKNPDEAYAIMAQREGLSKESFRAIVTDEIQILGLQEQKTHSDQDVIRDLKVIEKVLFETKQIETTGKINGSESKLLKGPSSVNGFLVDKI